jgi:SagB-type dehydrogenase family enzyme
MNDIGERFQQETKYRRESMAGRRPAALHPPPFRTFPGAPRISLAPPETKGGPSLWETMSARRSVRDFSERPMTLNEMSQVLWAAQGVTGHTGGFVLRTAPSAGALYPVETYASVFNVDGVEPGIYHHDVQGAALERLQAGDFRRETARAALQQGFVAESAFTLIWTAVFPRAAWKYGQRTYRYVYLDAGHIAQNAALAATALGLGSCQIAALFDDEVNALVGADGIEESVLYMTSVGCLASSRMVCPTM